MKFTAVAAVALAPVALGAKYPISAEKVNCREGPGTSFTNITTTYKKGDEIEILCQTEGTTISGNSIWDKTQDDCYVTDSMVKTGTDDYVADKCKDVPEPPDNGAGPMEDDYPYDSCSGVDKWAYYKCQCTSFVAWRINDRLGIKFHNQYKGCNYGNANEWDDCAKATGVTVNSTPKPGAVAQTNSGGGGFGHVAWVSAVDGSKVTIEEYNYATREGYGTRTVDKSEFNYIHVADS